MEKASLRSSFKWKAGLGNSGSRCVSSWWFRPRKLTIAVGLAFTLGCFSKETLPVKETNNLPSGRKDSKAKINSK